MISFYCIKKKNNPKNRPGQILSETNFFAQEKQDHAKWVHTIFKFRVCQLYSDYTVTKNIETYNE